MSHPVDRDAVRRRHRHLQYRSRPRHPLVFAADNLDKASNLGGIIRVADAFLTEAVITNREQPDVSGAMGAQHWQPVIWNVDLVQALTRYRDSGYAIVALEQTMSARSVASYEFPEKVVMCVGAEMFGVSEQVLTLAADTIYIPQAGIVKSLNVVTAVAIAAYEYSRQWWMHGFPPSPRHLAPSSESLRLEGVDLGKNEQATTAGQRSST